MKEDHYFHQHQLNKQFPTQRSLTAQLKSSIIFRMRFSKIFSYIVERRFLSCAITFSSEILFDESFFCRSQISLMQLARFMKAELMLIRCDLNSMLTDSSI